MLELLKKQYHINFAELIQLPADLVKPDLNLFLMSVNL